jgi:hypothetical protein
LESSRQPGEEGSGVIENWLEVRSIWRKLSKASWVADGYISFVSAVCFRATSGGSSSSLLGAELPSIELDKGELHSPVDGVKEILSGLALDTYSLRSIN